jgi:FkbM family methyltransferase
VRWLKRRRRVQRTVTTVDRARMVDRPVRFALREWGRSTATVRYRPRGAGTDVLLRHGTSDLDILDEVFGRRLYAVPAPVRAALAQAGGPLRVLDLGAHIGLFGAWALQEWAGAHVTAVEADPANAQQLRRTIELADCGPRWTLLPVVAAAQDGRVPFEAGGFAESHAGDHGDLTEARDVLPLMDGADLVKMDIEGGEWPILADPRLPTVSARALVLEYHGRGCPGRDPASAAASALHAAGFHTSEIPGAPVGAGMLWAWRKDAVRARQASA